MPLYTNHYTLLKFRILDIIRFLFCVFAITHINLHLVFKLWLSSLALLSALLLLPLLLFREELGNLKRGFLQRQGRGGNITHNALTEWRKSNKNAFRYVHWKLKIPYGESSPVSAQTTTRRFVVELCRTRVISQIEKQHICIVKSTQLLTRRQNTTCCLMITIALSSHIFVLWRRWTPRCV